MSDLKLRVKTDVQDDYSILEPLQLPQPLPGPEGAVPYPKFHTAVSRNADGTKEALNVFCETGYSTSGPHDVLHLFNSGSDHDWALESTHLKDLLPPTANAFPFTTVSSMVDAETGGLHIASSTCVGTSENGSPKVSLFYMNPNSRYKVWKSIQLPQVDPEIKMFPIVQLGLDDQSRVCVYYRLAGSENVPAHGGKWTPVLPESKALEAIPELTVNSYRGCVFSWEIAKYPDPAFDPALKMHSGFFTVVSEDTHPPRLWRHTIGADQAVRATEGIVERFQVVPSLDNSAPLIFTLSHLPFDQPGDQTQITFITNSHYLPSDVDNNDVPLFSDVPSKRTPKDVRAVVSRASGLNADGTPDVFRIDVLGLFQLPDGTYELWHTSNLRQGIKEVSDGVFSVAKDQWTSSFFVTNNILSPKHYNFDQRFDTPSRFGFENVDNVPTAVFVSPDMKFQLFKRDVESANWIQSEVSGVPDLNAPAPAMTTSRACVVEITTMLEDGTILPDRRYQLGTESVLNVEIAGKPYVLDSARTPELQFPSDGRLTIKIPNNGELLLPTFWISVEGMQDGAKVDVQPGLNGLHDAFRNVGTPGNKALADIVLPDGSPLVPAGQSAENLETATQALHAISDVITGDTLPAAHEHQYIYKSTSHHVARSRPQNAKQPTLGRLKRKNNVGFMFVCSGSQLTFRYLQAHELADAHASLLRGPMGIFDDIFGPIGDLFNSVVNGIAEAVAFVIETVGDAVKATVNFVIDGVTRVWKGVVDIASKAADLAIFVFDAIKTAIEKVIDWLKFWFNWNDIKLTARAFKGCMDNVGPKLTGFIDNTLVHVTDSAFAYAREHIDSSADAVIAALGSKAVGSFDSSVTSMVAPGGAGTNHKLGVLTGVSIQDILDGLSTAAGYFFDVFSFLLGGGFEQKLSSSLDSKKFLGIVDSFFSSLATQEVGKDLQAAWDDVKAFVSRFFSKSMFEAATLASLINAVRSVMKLGVDVMHALFQAMLLLFKEAVLFATDLFTAPVNVPVLSQLYSALMDEQCTLSGVLSLVLAVPCTLVYKAITGKAPVVAPTTAAGNAKYIDSRDAEIMVGVVTIVAGIFDSTLEIKKARTVGVGDAGLVIEVALQPVDSFHAFANIDEHTFDGPLPELQLGSQIISYIRLSLRVSRMATAKFTSISTQGLAPFYYAESMVAVSGLSFNLMVLAGSHNYTTRQTELGVSSILSCFSGGLAILRIGPANPATVAAALVQTALAITTGSLQIAAAKESSSLVVQDAGRLATRGDVRDGEDLASLGKRGVLTEARSVAE